MPAFKNLTGQRAGKLVVQSLFKMLHGRAYWLCVCDCDPTGKNFSIVLGGSLCTAMKNPTGGTRSCGCTRKRPEPKEVSPEMVPRLWQTMQIDEVRTIEGLTSSQFHSQVGKTRSRNPECRLWRWTARKVSAGTIEVRRIR